MMIKTLLGAALFREAVAANLQLEPIRGVQHAANLQQLEPITDVQPDDRWPVVYAALGDSYTSGPGIPNILDEACSRSDHNYPSYLKDYLKVDEFYDVSCAGAETANIFNLSQTRNNRPVPPQASSLPSKPNLITVGIGGNDENLFQFAIGVCILGSRPADRNSTSTPPELAAIHEHKVIEKLKVIGERLVQVYTQLRETYPDTMIVAVGYPRVMREGGICPEFRLHHCDTKFVVNMEERLDNTIAESAKKSGIHFISLHHVTQGHEMCSDDPARVNGLRPKKGRGNAFHPTPELMNLIGKHLAVTIPNLMNTVDDILDEEF